MGIRQSLEIPLTMLSISFLNTLPYNGSYDGKRFRFERYTDNADLPDEIIKSKNEEILKKYFNLKVYLWKDIFNFEKTNKEEMIIQSFEYSRDGINQGIDFVEKTEV